MFGTCSRSTAKHGSSRSITTNRLQSYQLEIESIKRSALPVVYHDRYSVEPWPQKHSFRMPKFKLLYEHLAANEFNFKNLTVPSMPSDDEISIAHSMQYIHAISNGHTEAYRPCNLPYSSWLAERAKLSLNGTLSACHSALKHGIGVQLSGGYHHAHSEHGSGFCIFNDLAYSALHLLANSESNGIRNILILDLDVHQGDGTASILQHVDNVFTVSVHCQANFPWNKQKSDIDIGLNTDVADIAYLSELRTLMEYIIANRHKSGHRIDLIIYDAGVDVHVNDKLGRLNITDQGLIDRDRLVFDTCLNYDIPVACVVGGGYDADDSVLAKRHGLLHWNALQVFNDYGLA